MPLPEPEILAKPVQPDAAIAFWQSRAKLTSAQAKALGEGARSRAFYVTGLAEMDMGILFIVALPRPSKTARRWRVSKNGLPRPSSVKSGRATASRPSSAPTCSPPTPPDATPISRQSRNSSRSGAM